MTTETTESVGAFDDHVDAEIATCLDLEKPVSFFLFAGAGSGKTRSVVTALRHALQKFGPRLRLHGQQIGVITYTNAACDEIVRRIDFDHIVHAATIHSFVWDLIKGFDADIRTWVGDNLRDAIARLKEEDRKGRAGTKTAVERARKIESKEKRLAALSSVRRFVYSPTGVNRGRDYLNHAEVIQLGAYFLNERPLMQQLLVGRFPILLIDESQDTNRALMEAFLSVERRRRGTFTLGLFGDTMQRIYTDGKVDLGQDLPADWAKPAKRLNYRSPQRIVQLINKIRAPVDGQSQQAAPDAKHGHALLFVYARGAADAAKMEAVARDRMAALTGDELWMAPASVKTLILEHHMAAKRLGFLEMFEPLYGADKLHMSLLEGTLPAVRFFSDIVMPLVDAKRRSDEFGVAAVVRKESLLLSPATLRAPDVDQTMQLRRAAEAVQALAGLWDNQGSPTFLQVLRLVASTQLLEVPESLIAFAGPPGKEDEGDEEDSGEITRALRQFLDAPFEQVRPYTAYVRRQTAFDTHQGVKGLEFPRVLVVMDDEEARGFSFNYEKLFGAQPRTDKDMDAERSGRETGIDRTRRLFYVTCSRAKSSLAIVAGSQNPRLVRAHAVTQGWFDESEIVVLS